VREPLLKMILRVRRVCFDRRQLHRLGLIDCDEQGQRGSGEVGSRRRVEIAWHDHGEGSDAYLPANRRGSRSAATPDPVGDFGKAALRDVHGYI
jgi:hypothetical protein